MKCMHAANVAVIWCIIMFNYHLIGQTVSKLWMKAAHCRGHCFLNAIELAKHVAEGKRKKASQCWAGDRNACHFVAFTLICDKARSVRFANGCQPADVDTTLARDPFGTQPINCNQLGAIFCKTHDNALHAYSLRRMLWSKYYDVH